MYTCWAAELHCEHPVSNMTVGIYTHAEFLIGASYPPKVCPCVAYVQRAPHRPGICQYRLEHILRKEKRGLSPCDASPSRGLNLAEASTQWITFSRR